MVLTALQHNGSSGTLYTASLRQNTVVEGEESYVMLQARTNYLTTKHTQRIRSSANSMFFPLCSVASHACMRVYRIFMSHIASLVCME